MSGVEVVVFELQMIIFEVEFIPPSQTTTTTGVGPAHDHTITHQRLRRTHSLLQAPRLSTQVTFPMI
jgi:hypothetical protein